MKFREFSGIKKRAISSISILLILMTVIILYFYYHQSYTVLKNKYIDNGFAIAGDMLAIIQPVLEKGDSHYPETILKSLYETRELSYILVYGRKNKLLVKIAEDVVNESIDEPVFLVARKKPVYNILKTPDSQRIFEFYHPIESEGAYLGLLRIGVDDTIFAEDFKRLLMSCLAVVLLLAILYILMFTITISIISKPFNELLNKIAYQLNENSFITVEKENGYVRLARVVNMMSGAIQNAGEELIVKEEELFNLKEKIKNDLDVAHNIQECLIPKIFPDLGVTSIYGFYKPMERLGGDFYDVFKLSSSKLAVVIADVCGHGVGAALITALARTSFRNNASVDKKPGETVKAVNDEIYNIIGKINHYLTAFYCVIDFTTNFIEYTNAGHPETLIITNEKNIINLKTNSFFVGIHNRPTFKTEHCKVNPGDRLVFYTDGIVDTKNASGELYDDKRFKIFLLNHVQEKPVEVAEKLLTEVNEFSNNHEADDDKTLLIVDITGELDKISIDLEGLEVIKRKDLELRESTPYKIHDLNSKFYRAIRYTIDDYFIESINILIDIKDQYNRKQDNFLVLVLLGYNYYKIHDKQKALEIWLSASASYPDDKKLLKNINYLQKILE